MGCTCKAGTESDSPLWGSEADYREDEKRCKRLMGGLRVITTPNPTVVLIAISYYSTMGSKATGQQEQIC